jgi:single-strand DNA-binding protein
MNRCIFIGRLTKDVETITANQTTIGKFSLAVERKFKREGDPDADFFDCVTFGKQAEFVAKYFHKGLKVAVEGRMQNDNYTNKDGQKVFRLVLICENVEFAESKTDGSGSGGNRTQQAASTTGQTTQTSQANVATEGFTEMPFDDPDGLPFG